MTPTAEIGGRIAVSAILAVIGSVALTRACDRVPEVIVWWLVYAVGGGVVLNSARGERPVLLAAAAVVPAVVPVGVLGFFVLAGKPICLSLPSPRIPLLLPLASWAAIFVFSFARTPIEGFVKMIVQPGAGKRTRRAIAVIQLLLSGVAAVVLGLSSLGR